MIRKLRIIAVNVCELRPEGFQPEHQENLAKANILNAQVPKHDTLALKFKKQIRRHHYHLAQSRWSSPLGNNAFLETLTSIGSS
jgi:hypothetical protein